MCYCQDMFKQKGAFNFKTTLNENDYEIIERSSDAFKEFVSIPLVREKLVELGSIPGHCMAASEALKIACEHNPNVRIYLKLQTFKPSDATISQVPHYRVVEPLSNRVFDPTVEQFGELSAEQSYQGVEPLGCGSQCLRPNTPPYFTRRKSSRFLLELFCAYLKGYDVQDSSVIDTCFRCSQT